MCRWYWYSSTCCWKHRGHVRENYSRGQPKPANLLLAEPEFFSTNWLQIWTQGGWKRLKLLFLDFFDEDWGPAKILGQNCNIYYPFLPWGVDVILKCQQPWANLLPICIWTEKKLKIRHFGLWYAPHLWQKCYCDSNLELNF
jgi:hypothetical protein